MRDTATRKADALAALEKQHDIWLATADVAGRPHIIAVSAWWDGTDLVVVTRGAEGAILVDEAGQEWHGRLEAWGPYPVGSGDAFLAGLVVARERGASWPEALKAALGAGAANAEVPGAGRLERDRAGLLAQRALVRE